MALRSLAIPTHIDLNREDVREDLRMKSGWAGTLLEDGFDDGPTGELFPVTVGTANPNGEFTHCRWDKGNGKLDAFVSTTYSDPAAGDQTAYVHVTASRTAGKGTEDRIAITDDPNRQYTFDELMDEFARPLPDPSATSEGDGGQTAA
ncbi:MAG TPA: hypothetical protein VLE99_03870 [Candidatus Saccharimonadales bacterium]|nr:hypothetical protein [Candidatus Saccharimonadales bacterium]